MSKALADDARVEIRDVGIWRIVVEKSPGSGFFWVPRWPAEFVETHAHLVRCLWSLSRDVVRLAPLHLAAYMLGELFEAISPVASLYASQRLLDAVQAAVVSRNDIHAHVAEFQFALALKLACHVLEWAFVDGITRPAANVLRARVRAHCGQRLLAATLALDVTTLQRPDVIAQWRKTSIQLPGDQLFDKVTSCWSNVFLLVEVLSQAAFLFQFFRAHQHGLLLAIACFLAPLTWTLTGSFGFGGVWFAYAIHPGYIRLRSVDETIKSKEFQTEILAGGLSHYFRKQYHAARASLGDTPILSVWDTIYYKPFGGGLSGLLQTTIRDAPFLVQLLTLARNPRSFSLTAMTLVQDASNRLQNTVWKLASARKGFVESAETVRDYFEFISRETAVPDGTREFGEAEKLRGMKIEFRNVTMKYPNSDLLALDNVSFTIEAGQTVLIVGENGSGKTTTVSLLARMYDCTSGEILINDVPIGAYKLGELRAAEAILRQDYQHFSAFTVAENIGLGLPHRMDDMARVRRAAAQGEAAAVVAEIGEKTRKLDVHARSPMSAPPTPAQMQGQGAKGEDEDGYGIDLKPLNTKTRTYLESQSPLLKLYESWDKPVELSGGQWQRLALARTFMRAPEASLVCVDEPSAALDPRAEYGILSRLRDLQGPTRIFITHRFGHLAKHADLILCLKQGRLVQSGTHEQLMQLGEGEYHELYKIQAQAFASATPPEASEQTPPPAPTA